MATEPEVNIRSKQITDLESLTMVEWLAAALRGDLVFARRVLDFGLDAEHYLALLPIPDSAVTPEQVERFNKLADKVERLLGQPLRFRRPLSFYQPGVD